MRISLASAVGLAAVLGVAASLAVAPDVRAGGTVAGSPSLFACYSAQFTAFRPQTRTIEDAWSGVASLSVYAPAAICVPAPGASTSYLTCFRVKVRTSQLAARAVSVVDAFSRISQRLRVYRLETVCVPSSRVDIGGSRLPVGGLDRFACYTAKASRPATQQRHGGRRLRTIGGFDRRSASRLRAGGLRSVAGLQPHRLFDVLHRQIGNEGNVGRGSKRAWLLQGSAGTPAKRSARQRPPARCPARIGREEMLKVAAGSASSRPDAGPEPMDH